MCHLIVRLVFGIEILSGLDAGTDQPVVFTFYDAELEPQLSYTHYDGFLSGDVTRIEIPFSGETGRLPIVKVYTCEDLDICISY